MGTTTLKLVLRAALGATLALAAGMAAAATTVNLSAQRATASLPDGTKVPMWQLCGALDATQTNVGTLIGGTCPASAPGAWTPGPTITTTAGDSLTINLTNNLNVPTSIVILGQAGGGLGGGTRMSSPTHNGQNNTTFPGGGPADIPFVPPAQGTRMQSMGTEAAKGNGTASLTWDNLKPGTYIYETGTLPSLEAPMGLYGLLIVNAASGTAYPAAGAQAAVAYDYDVGLLFSEIDPVMNAQIDAAAQAGTDIRVNLRFNDPSCATAGTGGTNVCFPAAVNYAPQYFLINGQAYDVTKPWLSVVNAGATATQGKVLLRMANAGLRTHIPSVVGLPFSIVAEDGNRAPGNAKVQNEVLLTAGKTHDATVAPASATGTYAAGTYAIFDRQGSLSNANYREGGMHGYLIVNGNTYSANGTPTGGIGSGAAGALPTATQAVLVDDIFATPVSTALNGNVRLNDIGVNTVAVVSGPSNGTLTLNANGTFTYTPTAGYVGVDSFTYGGNGSASPVATVSITVGSNSAITLGNDSYTSAVATVFTQAVPGVLANDVDSNGLPLSVDLTSIVSPGCVTVNVDGSFTATPDGAGTTCTFTYKAKNSQGIVSGSAATVTVNFAPPAGSVLVKGVTLKVVDAANGAAITDYRWVIQEDLTFKSSTSGTPSLSTRTLGTSFHRAHNTVVATGCVGPISCGDGQFVRGTAAAARTASQVSDVWLDPSKNYYISVLPGDAQEPVVGLVQGPLNGLGHQMGGTALDKSVWAQTTKTATIKLQPTPLVPAQLSIYIYEDNNPTNGQNDLNENGLGGFNIIIVDPVGRSGDPAGQQTYDAFNMPLTNSLIGQPGCPDELNPTSSAAAGNNIVGAIYTCPNDPNAGTPSANPAKYALAGHALIKNITPARYDVIAHPGAAREGAGEVWWQTETLEGTPAQDAFTGVNEPVYFQEFGPPGFHTTIGFVNPNKINAANTAATGVTVKGHVTNQRMSRPSQTTLYDSGSYDLLNSTVCQVALNSQGGTGPTIQVVACDADGNFTLTKVPAGSYEIVIWDQWLDQIIQTQAVTVGSTDVNMFNIPVLSWFTQHDQNQLLDDGNGSLKGIPNVLMSVRYRNGSISNQTLTDVNGNGILVELFPLFNWYVSESDTTRYKQKRVDVTVDGGGAVDTSGPGAGLWTSKYPTGESTVRSETPGAYSYGIQSFISQRNQINWIKTPYALGENGGIQGTVVYSSTRAFDDQRYNVQTIWEPLVPRVKVNLYQRVAKGDGTVSLKLVDTTTTTSFDDWVNLVKGSDGNNYILGPDQSLRDPVTGALAASGVTAGVQVNMQCPGQLPGPAANALPPFDTTQVDPFTNFTLQGDQYRCYDGFHNWNQVQAAPYDGKYQFPSDAYVKAHPLTTGQIAAGQTLVSLPPGDYVVEIETPAGYMVAKEEDKNILIGDAFVAPAVQQFGGLASIFILPDQATLNNGNPFNPANGTDTFGTNGPAVQINPTTDNGVTSSSIAFAECVGALHRVPDFLSLFPQAGQAAPFAGMDRPLCDKKLVKLGDQMQAAATFFVFTDTPVAANATGIILDDASSEFNAYSPDFGEKASVPFVPVSTKDWAGNEVSRVYSDQWGAYNLMLPSSWLVNPPTPSGYGPNMMVNCINDPGPIPATNAQGQYVDVNGVVVADPKLAAQITDPAYNPAYSNFCYTNPFMPGQATYLDTPVLPIAAFAAGYNPVDCAEPDATPMIARVDSSAGFGPYLPVAGGTLTIKAMGDQQVQNPGYAGPFATSGPASQRTITRHYGFGSQTGTVRIGTTPATVTSWTDSQITVTVPANTPTGQLVVTAVSDKNGVAFAKPVSTTDAVTVTLEAATPTRVVGANGDKIQAAVDSAKPGDLILVDAGTYNELVVMWKPVRLQGVGAGSVIINAAKYPTSKLQVWRPTINAMFGIDSTTGNAAANSQVDPLPGQEITGGVVLLEPSVLGTEEGAGITVLAKGYRTQNGIVTTTPLTNSAADCAYASTTVAFDLGNGANTVPQPGLSNFLCAPSRIDGISVTGGDAGGGIYVNGWAHNLEISNNRVYGNAGALNGGVRIGVPYLEIAGYPGQTENADGTLGGQISRTSNVINGLGYDRNVKIHHNAITKNGVVEGTTGQGGAGGGVSISAGTDNYSVDHNLICGNYSQSDGGGIGHLGFSQNGTIAFNRILFNQTFQQTTSTHGGGIFVGGEPALALQTQTLGTGNLTIDGNIIRGNFAEAGHGGGIRLQQVNGADVQNFPGTQASWNKVTVVNNIIDNNVAGWAGGGLSMADTLLSVVDNNTIASNDSVGIAGPLLAGGALPSTTTAAGTGKPNPAGVSSDPTSAQLAGILGGTALTATQKAISSPALVNNIVWKNRSFFFKVLNTGAALCSSSAVADAGGTTCTQLPDQTATGQCTGSPAYWDLGVLGDTSAATPGANHLQPVTSVLTTVGAAYSTLPTTLTRTILTATHSGTTVTIATSVAHGYALGQSVTVSGVNRNAYNGTFTITAIPTSTTFRYTDSAIGNAQSGSGGTASVQATVASGNIASDPQLVDFYCNGARITPEFAGVINPPSPKNLQVAATVDEGNNYVNMRYGPLSITKPADANGGSYVAFGDYHLQATSPAIDVGTNLASVTTHDVDNQTRPVGSGFDIGADEYRAAAPVAALSPTTLAFGAQALNTSASRTVTLSNTGDAPLAVQSIVITGSAGFTTTNCGASVAIGGSCTITVTFNPATRGRKAATLTVTDNNNGTAGSTQTVALSGIGVPAAPALTVRDNFNRANANTLGGNWQQVVAFGAAALRVNNNQAFCNSAIGCPGFLTGAATWNAVGSLFGAAEYGAVTFVTTPSNDSAVTLKVQTIGILVNAVRVRYNGGQVFVETTTDSGLTFANAGTFPATFANGDKLVAAADETGAAYVWKVASGTGTVTFVGAALLPTSAAFTTNAGRVGVHVPNNGRVDDFSAGVLP